MPRHWIVLLLTVVSSFAIPKSSTKRELQRLVRLPRLEFSKPIEFERRFGFVPFADLQSAGLESGRLFKERKSQSELAPLYLQAARIHDRQEDAAAAASHYSRAADLFKRRVEIAPRDTTAIAGLGEALAAIGRFAEAEAALDRADELGVSIDVLLARARLFRERAWFAAAGETRRYRSGPFLSQLVSMAVEGPAPARIEESRRFLRLARESLAKAFEIGSEAQEECLLERAAFRSFAQALELAFTQIQNEDLRPRSLDLALFNAEALQDLRDAAAITDEASVIAASAMAANLAAERAEGSGRSAESYVKEMATRLQEIVDRRSEESPAAAEYLGSIQFHVLRDIAGARRTLRQATALAPARHRAWELLMLAAAYEGSEHFVEVAEDRVAALPHPRSSALLVKSLDMAGDRVRAEWAALNAVVTYPNDLVANLSLAAVLLKDENAEQYLWRVEEALGKAEKALGSNRNHQNRVDYYLLKGIHLGMADRADQAKALLQSVKPSAPELQEVLRALD